MYSFTTLTCVHGEIKPPCKNMAKDKDHKLGNFVMKLFRVKCFVNSQGTKTFKRNSLNIITAKVQRTHPFMHNVTSRSKQLKQS